MSKIEIEHDFLIEEQFVQSFEGKLVCFEHLEYRENEARERGGARRAIAFSLVKNGKLGSKFLIDIRLGANPEIDKIPLDVIRDFYGSEVVAIDLNGYSFMGLNSDYVIQKSDDADSSTDWTQFRSLSQDQQIKGLLQNSGFTVRDHSLKKDIETQS